MYELKSAKETVAELVSDEKSGLTSEEASKRLAQYGQNELLEKKKEPLIITFLKQFNDPMIYILIAAAVISLVVSKFHDWNNSRTQGFSSFRSFKKYVFTTSDC